MRIPHRQVPRKVDNPACGPKNCGDRETFRTSEAMRRKLAEEASIRWPAPFPPRHALNPQRSALAPSTRRSSGQAVVVQCLVLPRRGPALRAAQSAYALSDGFHIGCACASTGPAHFLDPLARAQDMSAWRPSVFNDQIQLTGARAYRRRCQRSGTRRMPGRLMTRVTPQYGCVHGD